jgi:hypothetical protein
MIRNRRLVIRLRTVRLGGVIAPGGGRMTSRTLGHRYGTPIRHTDTAHRYGMTIAAELSCRKVRSQEGGPP